MIFFEHIVKVLVIQVQNLQEFIYSNVPGAHGKLSKITSPPCTQGGRNYDNIGLCLKVGENWKIGECSYREIKSKTVSIAANP